MSVIQNKWKFNRGMYVLYGNSFMDIELHVQRTYSHLHFFDYLEIEHGAGIKF